MPRSGPTPESGGTHAASISDRFAPIAFLARSAPNGSALQYRGLEPLPVRFEEHCQECAAPSCYEQCALYEPNFEVGCRRFAFGILVEADSSCWTGTYADIVFKRWGRLKAKSVHIPTASVWRHAFLLQLYVDADPCREFGASLALSPSPWTADVPAVRVPLVLSAGMHEVYLPAADLQCLHRAVAVEASFCFADDVPNAVRIYSCGFVTSVADTTGDRISTRKLVCVDLDHTLWNGAVGERTPAPEPFPWVSRVLGQLRQRGIRLAVVSRADSEWALPYLEELGWSGLFDAVFCGVSSKAAAVRKICEDTGVWLDETVFVDDDGYERAEVTALCPGSAARDERALAGLAYDPLVTAQSTTARGTPHRPAVSGTAFLHGLGSVLRLRSVAEAEDLVRCWELLQRTNRLNCAEWRPSLAALEETVSRRDVVGLAGWCSDRTSDYGLTCFAIAELTPADARVISMTFSCRLLGRGFPDAFVAAFRDSLLSVALRIRVANRPAAKADSRALELVRSLQGGLETERAVEQYRHIRLLRG